MGVADNQVLSPLLPTIQTQFSKSATDMGFLFTGYAFCAGLSVLIWGPLSDAFGRKRGLMGGLALFLTGSFISFGANGFAALLAGRMLTGMGASMLSLNAISYAADYFPYRTRGWAMGSIFASYFAALILGVPLGSLIGERWGWNVVFGAMGGMALCLFVATQRLLPPLRRKNLPIHAMKPGAIVRQYIGFMMTKTTMSGLLSSMFASAGTMGFIAFLGAWLHDDFGIAAGQIGLVFLISGFGALLASPFAGAISDRIGKRIQFVLSSIVLAIFLFVLPGMVWGPPLFAIFGAISLSAAFRQGPMEAILSELVYSDSRGRFIALKNSFSQLGIGLATLLSGMLFEHGGYRAVCILCAVSNVLAAGSMMLISREKHSNQSKMEPSL
jgi:predicted MFS family arabinose efflux permease